MASSAHSLGGCALQGWLAVTLNLELISFIKGVFLGELILSKEHIPTAMVGFDEVCPAQAGLNAKHWNWQGYLALPNPRRIFQVVRERYQPGKIMILGFCPQQNAN